MQNEPVLFLVGTQCAPEIEEEFNQWYNETHIPMLLKSDLLKGVTRYKRAPITLEFKEIDGAARYEVAPLVEGEDPAYLAIYEFKDRQAFEAFASGPENIAAAEDRKQMWGGKGFETKWRLIYEPIESWHK